MGRNTVIAKRLNNRSRYRVGANKNLLNASEISAIIVSIIYTCFYLSYIVRNLLKESSTSLADLYDANSALVSSVITLMISAAVLIYLIMSRRRLHPDGSPARRFSKKQAALAVATLLALAIVYLYSPKMSYEGLHQNLGQSSIGKLLYIPYIYYSYILAKGLEKKPEKKQTLLEFMLISLGFTLLVPMRSPIFTHALVLIIIYQPRLRLIYVYSLAMAFLFLVIAIVRQSTSLGASVPMSEAIAMLIFGASIQIDLYEITIAHGYRSSRELYELLSLKYENYFDQGGGFGSFIAIEIERFLPLNGVAPYIFALVPLGLRRLGKTNKIINGLVIIVGINALTIIRNPISSWINGYIVSLVFYELFKRRKSNN